MPKFLNETVHPKAQALINHIIMCACKKDKSDSQFYNPLKFWREAQGMTDEKAADLYARLEEAFPLGVFLAGADAFRMREVSLALWQNDEAVAA